MTWLLAIALCAAAPHKTEALVWKLERGEVRLEPERHAARLFEYVTTQPDTGAAFAPAQHWLARALAAQGYKAAAAAWLARIARERLDPERVPAALEELMALQAGPHDEALAEAVFANLDVASLSARVAARAHLVQGTLDLKAGRDAWARAHFEALAPQSPELARARWATLVTRLKRGEDAARVLPAFAALAAEASAPDEVRLDAQLAVARLRYESRDDSGALAAYAAAKVPPLSPGRAPLYVEEAWAHYRMGRPNEVLGRLLVLDAPAFEGLFLPDKHLLRALVYLEACHYLPARRAARELVRQYASSLEAVRERRALGDDAMLRAAALGKGPAQRAQAWVAALQQEADGLLRDREAVPAALRAHLEELYTQALGEATRARDAALERALVAEGGRLLEAAEQVRVVEYEVGLALNARLKDDAAALVPGEQNARGPEDVAYRFSGEYWNDELRDIQFKLENRCQEARR